MNIRHKVGQQGSALIVGLVVASALGAGIVFYMNTMKKLNVTVKSLNDQKQSLLVVSKLRTFGSYLVSTNAIICKQQPFSSQLEGYRCKWNEQQLVNGSTTIISKSKLGLSENPIYSEDGFLTFDVDSAKVATPEDLKEMGTLNFKGKIGFKLYDALEDSLNLASKLGPIPVLNLEADNDRTIVLLRVEIDYKKGLDTESSQDNSKSNTVTQYFSVRRPIAIPKLKFSIAKCKLSCATSSTRNDNPACRGDQNYLFSQEATVTATTENLGPGVLYDLHLQREIAIDKELFPNADDSPKTKVNAMGSKDYLLPGETVQWTDKVVCLNKKESIEFTKVTSTWDTSRPPVCYKGICAANSSANPCLDQNIVNCSEMEDSASQHFSSGGKATYRIDVSPFDLKKKNAVIEAMKISHKQGVLMNYKFPQNFANTDNLSSIEPARTAIKINIIDGDIPVRVDSTASINEVKTH